MRSMKCTSWSFTGFGNEKSDKAFIYAGRRSGSGAPGSGLLAGFSGRPLPRSVRESSMVGDKGKTNQTIRPDFEAHLGRYDGNTNHAEFVMFG